MKKELLDLVNTLKANSKIAFYDKSQIIQSVVLPVLSALKWEIFDVEEVFPNYPLSSGDVDFSLRLNNENKVFIMVGRPGEDMGKKLPALLNFSKEASTPIGILTDGIEWHFYLPLQEGERSKFFHINILMQDPEDITQRFVDFLAKDKVLKGKAQQNAEKIFKSRKKKSVVREALQKVMDEFLTAEVNPLTVSLSSEAEKIAGYPVEPSDVESFLKSLIKKRRGRKTTRRKTSKTQRKAKKAASSKKKTEKASKEKKSVKKTRTVKPPVSEDSPPYVEKLEDLGEIQKEQKIILDTVHPSTFIGKKPKSFTFLGQPIEVKKWKDVLTNVCNILAKARENDFEKVLELKGRKRLYFSKNPDDLKEPKQVIGTDIYVETNFNASNLYSIILKVLKAFGYSEKDISIETKERKKPRRKKK